MIINYFSLSTNIANLTAVETRLLILNKSLFILEELVKLNKLVLVKKFLLLSIQNESGKLHSDFNIVIFKHLIYD